MSLTQITAALWRRRLLFAITFLACFGMVAVITASVPRVYRATATLYVGSGITGLTADQGEALSRTYTTLASNPNNAQDVIGTLHLDLSRTQLLDKMSFTPVERTQLLEIAAEDHSASQAQKIANTYADVFATNIANQVAAGDASANVSVNQPAAVPTDPVRPNPPVYLGLGFILALLIASGVVVVRDQLDRRVRIGPHDEDVQGQPILARIPTLLTRASGGNGPDARFANVARIMRSDAFRVLRTNLELAGGGETKTITITSAGAGEGKTTIAAQLALTIAADREPVAIVECDLRRRALSESGFEQGLRRSKVGLAEYLDGDASLKQILTSAPGSSDLTIVWAGKAILEPGPLLHSDRLPELLQYLTDHNEWVILDTPPLAVGDDALLVSSLSDGALIVVDAEETVSSALQDGLNQLRKVHASILGVALNHAPPAGLSAYQYLTEEPAHSIQSSRRGQARQSQNR